MAQGFGFGFGGFGSVGSSTGTGGTAGGGGTVGGYFSGPAPGQVPGAAGSGTAYAGVSGTSAKGNPGAGIAGLSALAPPAPPTPAANVPTTLPALTTRRTTIENALNFALNNPTERFVPSLFDVDLPDIFGMDLDFSVTKGDVAKSTFNALSPFGLLSLPIGEAIGEAVDRANTRTPPTLGNIQGLAFGGNVSQPAPAGEGPGIRQDVAQARPVPTQQQRRFSPAFSSPTITFTNPQSAQLLVAHFGNSVGGQQAEEPAPEGAPALFSPAGTSELTRLGQVLRAAGTTV